MPRAPQQNKPQNIDDYLARLDDDKRAALQKLRKTIHSAAPKAEECISYGLAAWKLNGMLVAMGATANHCAFYLMSGSTVEEHAKELAPYDTTQGTICLGSRARPLALLRKKLG